MSSSLPYAESRLSLPLLGPRFAIWTFIFFVMLALTATWSIYRLTPMISDDFSYANKGIAWDAIARHYLNWSGRLVSDTLSSALLSLAPPWLKASLGTAALAGVILILSALGARLAGQTLRPSIVLLVFMLYWLMNPDLGQTTFWLVGSANYLWPNLFNFGFALAYVWRLQKGTTSPAIGLGLCALAVLAGCSNENTGIISWCLLAGLSIKHYRRTRSLGTWPLIWLVCMGIGVSLLVLAPGNQVRAEFFTAWYDQPLTWRLWEHFSRRFPDAMLRYWGVILVMLVWRVWSGPTTSAPARRMIWLLVAASLLANAILMLAPNIPKRALNGSFMYLLVALSIYGHDLLARSAHRANIQRALTLTLGVCAVLWLVSTALILRSYYGTWQQNHVRQALIARAIEQGHTHIDLPGYHFRTTLRSRDRFDTYFNGEAMARYYGIEASIAEYAVRQHYDLGSGAPPKP